MVAATGQTGRSGRTAPQPHPAKNRGLHRSCCGQFSQGHGGLELISRSRTEGHASDIDLTCSRLIVAHLPTGRTTHKGALSDAPSYRLTVSTFVSAWRDSAVGSIISGSLPCCADQRYLQPRRWRLSFGARRIPSKSRTSCCTNAPKISI